MFLVCQLCYEPQTTSVWPVKLERSSDRKIELAAKVLPVAKAGLQVAAVFNTAAGIGRLLGYPIPTIPVDLVKENLGFLESTSNVAEYSELEKKLFEAGSERTESTEGQEGYMMREYRRFLEEFDKTQDWGRLQRLLLDEGTALWCCEKCVGVVKLHQSATFDELRGLVCPNTPNNSSGGKVTHNPESKKSVEKTVDQIADSIKFADKRVDHVSQRLEEVDPTIHRWEVLNERVVRLLEEANNSATVQRELQQLQQRVHNLECSIENSNHVVEPSTSTTFFCFPRRNSSRNCKGNDKTIEL